MGTRMLTAAYIRETILLIRQWDRAYADIVQARVVANVPWLMKEPEPATPAPAADGAHAC